MQKKLIALAVAGVLAAPVAAMAQSSVTISGVFKESLDKYTISNGGAARPAGANLSEWRITDNSSRVIFGITEDLGGGMSAIGQLDMRPMLDAAGGSVDGGNDWVGVRSTSWGTVTLGRHDLHYGKQPDDIASKAGALMAASVSLMDFTFNGKAIANATRTNNVIRYDSPNWSGFAFTAAVSQNPGGTEADLNSAVSNGHAYTVNPSYTTGNFGLGWSYWNQKADGGGASSDQKSNVFYGYWTGGGFKVGAAVNKSKVESNTGVAFADRTNWTIPVSWTSGPHNVYAHYTKAGKDKVGVAGVTDDTDAKMIALAYVYDLSKRTSVGVTYAKIDNKTNAAYNFFTNTGGLGSANSTLTAGEDGQLLSFTVRHAF